MEVFVDPKYYLFGNSNDTTSMDQGFNTQDLSSLFKMNDDMLNSMSTMNEELLNIDLGV